MIFRILRKCVFFERKNTISYEFDKTYETDKYYKPL